MALLLKPLSHLLMIGIVMAIIADYGLQPSDKPKASKLKIVLKWIVIFTVTYIICLYGWAIWFLYNWNFYSG